MVTHRNMLELYCRVKRTYIVFRKEGRSFVDLAKWIEKNNYLIKENEPGREIYLPLSTKQDAQLMEIQIPIINT